MTEKSYVSMERRICIVCGTEYDTNALLIDKHLRASLDRYTITGWGLCSKDEQLFNAGFAALVEIDPAKSGSPPDGASVKPEQVYRTGALAHLRRDIAAKVFNVPIRQGLPCVFVEPGMIRKLQAATHASTDRADAT
ncbi:ATPase [Peristeroidobacter agariperforans]|uniref:ATPase n=1 Tax=Peristeroidobacter agariperforans TaxID=268404 RepID=UPI00101CA46E|nr:ATPase [Peristeroidobacter agariperforans]